MELNDPFATAVAEAETELGEATPDESLAPEPGAETEVEADEDQAVGEESEQTDPELEPPAEQDTEDSDELFGDLEVDEVETEAQPALADDTTFELPGLDEPVSLQELKDGYLRQADYTRKTQGVAEQVKTNQQAVDFWQALQQRPQDVVRQLAERVGLISEGAQPTKVVDLPFRTAEEIQAEVDQKVAEALENHPEVQEAKSVLGQYWVESEFARIETELGIKLGKESREKVLRVADAKGIPDLEIVVNAMLAQQQAKARQRDSLKNAAPAKPSGKAIAQTAEDEVASFDDAVAQAMAELGV